MDEENNKIISDLETNKANKVLTLDYKNLKSYKRSWRFNHFLNVILLGTIILLALFISDMLAYNGTFETHISEFWWNQKFFYNVYCSLFAFAGVLGISAFIWLIYLIIRVWKNKSLKTFISLAIVLMAFSAGALMLLIWPMYNNWTHNYDAKLELFHYMAVFDNIPENMFSDMGYLIAGGFGILLITIIAYNLYAKHYLKKWIKT